MTISRRTFSAASIAGAAGSLTSTRGMAANPVPTKARNIVLVHGLFADGSNWSEVIRRLQAVGLNVTSVQNPLTTLPEAVAAAERVLARQDGPTVLAGHSFSGMIVTQAGVHPNVSQWSMWRRAPGRGRGLHGLAKTYPTPPATAGIVFDGDEGRLTEEAFLRDFGVTCRRRRQRRSMRCSSRSTRLCSLARLRTRHGDRSRATTLSQRKTAQLIRISSASWRRGWEPRPSKLNRAMSR